MRLISLVFVLLMLSSCGSSDAPVATAPVTPAAPVAQEVVPTDQQVTGDPAIDNIRTEANRIDAQFQTGMLQQKNVTYACNQVRGLLELYTEKGETVLTRSKYSDGDTRTVIDNSYFKGGQLIYHYSEINDWQLDGTMRTLNNNHEVPGVQNTTIQYRYYIADGAIFKSLKRKFDHFTYATDNPNPDTLPLEEMPLGEKLPLRYGLAKSALETGVVDCGLFE